MDRCDICNRIVMRDRLIEFKRGFNVKCGFIELDTISICDGCYSRIAQKHSITRCPIDIITGRRLKKYED